MLKKIDQFAEKLAANLTDTRRDFHKYAEAGWTEFRTASIIARRLHDLGFEVKLGREVVAETERMGVPDEAALDRHYQRAMEQGADAEFLPALQGGFTGVVGILRCGEGPVIGMRFDIDAVEMKESTAADHRPVQEGFASINPEAMHSCGHDGHATIGLGVAAALAEFKDQLRGTLKLVFQPAEEGVRGAKAVVASGVLDDVDYMLASHLGSGTPTGTVAGGRGGFLATSKFDAFIEGAPAHAGGKPEGGHNAVLAAATAALNLYAIPRHSQGATRVNVGRLVAGSGRNVIPPSAHLVIETRGATTDLEQHMYNYAIGVLENAAAMHGCRVSFKPMGGAKSGVSDMDLARRVNTVAANFADFKDIKSGLAGGGGSEDYTYMMARVQEKGGQATFMNIGADINGAGHHTAEFDFDERALVGAVKLFVATALDIMQN